MADTPQAPAPLPRQVWAIAWVSYLTDASTELIYALLPSFYQATLGLNALWQGLIEGFAESLASVTKLFSGRLSDRTGNRRLWMIAGYSLSTLSKPLLAFAGSAPAVIGLRGADRLGKGVRGAPRDAILSHVVTEDVRGRAYGLHRAMDHAGALTGGLVASALLWLGWVNVHQLFWGTLIPGGLAVLVIVLFVKEPARPAAAAKPSLNPAAVWRESSPRFRRYLLVLAIFALGNSTDALLLLRAREQLLAEGFTPDRATALLPLLWAWLHVFKSLFSTHGGKLSDRFGRRPLLVAGWLVYAGVYVGFALWQNAAAPWVLFGVYGLFYALTEGPEKALVADLSPADRRGSAFGLFHLVIGLASLPASALCGGLWKFWGPHAAFLTGAALALLAALLLPWALRRSGHQVADHDS